MSLLLLLLHFFLLLQPWSIVAGPGDILAPLLSPIFDDDVCKEVKCGQGSCKPLDNSTIPYECECSPGWKQLATFAVDDDNQFFKFLPCVIPNCTLDYSCSKAPPPVQQKENRGNTSIFDVCQWTDCGGGRCEPTSLFTHKCECSNGYHNLLNLTFSPCFKECSLGMDCKDLNIGFMDKPSSPPPSLSADRSNQASNYRIEGRYQWLILLMFAFLAI
ncbi:hypothetical protein M8C21_022790 [Ambrosia artemisiifolia]|uniref:Uncharacterized protein n=1 Tax=Ambrosia artemisiifolia TaxID=4212 RepID=A0AAD5CBJ3_AMBAR|nr:hypothetical protein M8C21_022790 [Ambrosia artemisiifolia]